MTLNELLTPERKNRFRRYGQGVVGFCLVGMIFCTGGMTGYWWRDNIAERDELRHREDHLAEIKRLTDAYGRNVTDLSRDAANAASSVQEAARAVEDTSAKAGKAAVVATEAAVQSRAAVQQAKQAAAAVSKIDTLPEPTRQQINRRVEEVNKRVAK